uniref:Uncharacterized protein LOC105113207 isoform X1 n=1 Tax=Rhizophora mucronata TaxID=61149 RepID=A0A2P2K0V2_RHIMU
MQKSLSYRSMLKKKFNLTSLGASLRAYKVLGPMYLLLNSIQTCLYKQIRSWTPYRSTSKTRRFRFCHLLESTLVPKGSKNFFMKAYV